MADSGSPPQGPPPAGWNLPDDNHNVEIIAGTAVTTALALAIVSVRCYTRFFIIRSFGSDDRWIFAAMFLSLVGFAIVVPSVYAGAGRHIYHILMTLGPAKLVLAFKLNFATQFIYVFALSFVKISIGLFLLRLAPSGLYQKFIWSVIGFVVFYTLAGSAALMSSCRPFAANFDRTVAGATCWTPTTAKAMALTNSSLGILTDLIFATLPIPLLWTLQINRKTKYVVIGILGLGLFAASASIVKLYYLTGYGRRQDFLYDSAPLTIWSVTEVNTSIIAASIPALKPLFKSVLGSTYPKNTYENYPSRKYEQQSSQSGEVLHNSRLRSSNTEAFELRSSSSKAAVRSGRDRERDKLGFNISEESILPLQSNAVGEGGIVKTTQVSVRSAPVEDGRPRSVEDQV